eukprot:scaffold240850_cov36-Tisochrysis_lutea.AAC.1
MDKGQGRGSTEFARSRGCSLISVGEERPFFRKIASSAATRAPTPRPALSWEGRGGRKGRWEWATVYGLFTVYEKLLLDVVSLGAADVD